MNYQVSEENLNKVETYFVEKVKETGSNTIEATVIEIAEGSNVALATAHKAIQQLERDKVIGVFKPKSRRFPITYTYKKSIDGFVAEQTQNGQINYLQQLVEKQKKEIADLKKKLNAAIGEKHILENRNRNA